MFNLNKLLNRKSEESRSPSRSESLIYNAEENADRKSGSAEGFLCPSCYLAFPTAELLQNHYESSHPEGTVGTAGDGRGAFNCPDCKMKLGSEIELQSHYKRHHSTSKDQVEVEALKMQVTALQEGKALVLNEIQALRSQVPDLLKENSKIKEHRDSLEQRAAMLAGDVANLKAAFDEVNSKKSSLELELKKAQEKIQDLEIEIQQRPEADDVSLLRQEIVSVQKMMDKQTLQREAEKDALQKQCSTLHELCKRLEAEKCALETSLKTAPKRNDVESLQTKVSNMKSRITELQGNMDLMAVNNAELTSAIENCADYEDVKRELVEKEVLLQDCTKSLEAKDEIIKMLNSDLKCEKEATERMKAGAEKLFSKIVEGEGASTAIDQLKEENCRLQEQFLHQQKITVQVTQEMESKLTDFQIEIKQVKAEVQVYQDKCTELEKELSSFKSKLQTCSLEKENLAVQVENHKENFSGMESTYKAHRTALQEELEGYKVRLNENVQSYVLLKNKVEESEKIQSKLLEEKAGLQNRIDSLVKEISETTSQLKLLVSEKEIRIGEMENNLAEFISKYSQKEEENYIINMQMKELKKSYEEVTYKLEEAQQQIASVEAAKLECVEKLNNAEKELLKCQENVEQLTLSFVNLNEVKMQLSEKVIVYDKETSELISVVDSLTKEKDSISNQLQSLTTEFIEMKQLSSFQEMKIAELTESYQNEKESRSREVQDLENAKQLLINQKVAQLKELEKVKEEEETKITGFRNSLEKMEAELQSSTIKYKTLAAKLMEADKSANQSKEEWENREAHFQAQIGVLSENAQTLREDLLAEHNKRETLDQKCDELSGNKLELEAKLENALDERRALLDRCLKSESECEKLQRTSADLRRKLDDTIAALQELGRENQTLQIENSKHMGRKWADDAEVTHCTACGILFTVTLRKHHCRNCGNIFCNECSSKNTVVAASKRPVRVCDMCYTEMSK